MSIEWLLYFIDLISHLSFLMTGLVGVAIIGIFISFVLWQVDYNRCEEESELLDKRIKICASILFIALVISVFIPSEKTMYAIALAHYSKQSDISDKVLKAIEVKLDEVIEGVKK